MKNKKTLYHFILDRSGSMCDVREQTVTMFNKQVATVQELDKQYEGQEFHVGLTIFNETIEHRINFRPSSELELLRYEQYLPYGMTALFDAIGASVDRIKEQFSDAINNNEMSVVIVVLTDGHENASTRYDMAHIAGLIKELENTGKWTFSILGADFDITQFSDRLNFKTSSTRQYSKKSFYEIEDDMDASLKSYASKKSKGIIDKEFLKFKKR